MKTGIRQTGLRQKLWTLVCGVAVTGALVPSVATAAGGAVVKIGQRPSADADHVIYSPARGAGHSLVFKATANLTSHSGPVIVSARVVFIFWGPSFGVGGADHAYATALQADRNQFGTTPEYNVITQYCGSNGCIQLTNLGAGTADWFDSSTPPANVTDALVQSKVNAYLAARAFDPSTIYEVVIPSTSYSSSGGSTSCGGPALAYCAYHGWVGSGTNAIKYSIQPYPSCAGCQAGGFTLAQDQQLFFCHETREAVTDPVGTGWWDASGNEADDKCAWSPPAFLGTGGFAYQWEWSNRAHGCVQTK